MRVVIFSLFWSLVVSQTITFRRLKADSSSTNESFVFNGSNSDISQQLFIRHRANETMEKVELSTVPESVKDRLDPLNINFQDLPGTVQRAVLWDTGFALSPKQDPVQIWTIGNYTMTDLVSTREETKDAGCTFVDCEQPNNVTASYVQGCTGDQMLSVARCVVDTFEDSEAAGFLGTMWSNGGDSTMAPHIRLRHHSWTDPSSGVPYSVYAVHTVSSTDEVTWNQCPSDGEYASLTVPCHRRDKAADEIVATMATVTGSDWVTKWLEEEFATDSDSSFDLLLLIPIIAGSVVLISILWLLWLYWRRKTQEKTRSTAQTECVFEEISTPVVEATSHPSTRGSSASDTYQQQGSNHTLRVLLGSEHLRERRIPLDTIEFERALAKGASGEIWICRYKDNKVAVKRLLQTKDQKAENVQAFAEEIELNASLVHPNIVEFIGVAWNSLNNLVMVIEYVPEGNLRDFLHQNVGKLSWARDKIYIAIGIAQALDYLHSRSPKLIHRDLKSTNVLLTKQLEPKLIDFGVSRGILDLTMTAGVGTPFWTAPEILEGKRYTEKADIYSFGVVLSELDTQKTPYQELLANTENKVKPFHILHEVMAGALRPNFSGDCPSRIRMIGLACMAHPQANRPTAKQIVQALEGDGAEWEYSL